MKIENQSFSMSSCLMTKHYHTEFGYKRLIGSEDIILTKSGHTDRNNGEVSEIGMNWSS